MSGNTVPDCTLGHGGPEEVFERIGPVERVLVLRTARMWQVTPAIEALRRICPGAGIDILVQPSAAEGCAAVPGVREVVAYPAEKMRVSNTPLKLLFEIRRKKYDLVVIVLNNEFGFYYDNVYRLAGLLGARHRVTYNPYHDRWDYRPLYSPGPLAAVLISPLALAAAALAASAEAVASVFVKRPPGASS